MKLLPSQISFMVSRPQGSSLGVVGPYCMIHLVTSLIDSSNLRLALDWTKRGGQNQLGTWEMGENSGAWASKFKDQFVAGDFPSPLSKSMNIH